MPSDYLTINSKTGQIKSKVNVEKPIYFMVRALALDGSNMIAEHEIILVKKTNGLNIFPKNVTLFTGMGSTPIELTGTQNTIGFDGYKVTVSNKKVVTAYIKDVNAEVTEGTRLIITPVAKGTATIKLKALDGTGKTQTIKVTVNNPVRELNISSKNGTDTITLGKSITLKANVNKDATNKKVKWELVNPMDSDFAKLTQSGKLTLKSIPIKGNSVTVKATTKDGTNISDTFTVNIAEFCAKSINVYDSTGVKAKKFKLSTSACPNGTLVTNVNVSVTLDGNYVDRYRKVVAISSDESIVSVAYEDNGIFNIMSGYKTGKATVKFIANDGSNKSVSVTVNVVRPVLTLKIATATGYDYLSDGSTLKLSTYANDATNKSVKWSAEGANKELVSVDSKGVVKVTQPITRNTDVIIRATAVDGSGVYDEKVLTLVPKQGNISVLVYAIENGHKVIKNVSTIKVGETVEMYFLGEENVLNDYKVTYNDELARVQYVTPDPNLISGCNTAVKITAKKAGTLKIKATAKDGSGKSVTYSIAVK